MSMKELVSNVKQLVRDRSDLQDQLDAALLRIAELETQLPEGMKHCTIQFKECGKGHGWLTATNWVQLGCQQCEKEQLETDNAALREQLDRLNSPPPDRDWFTGAVIVKQDKDGSLLIEQPRNGDRRRYWVETSQLQERIAKLEGLLREAVKHLYMISPNFCRTIEKSLEEGPK